MIWHDEEIDVSAFSRDVVTFTSEDPSLPLPSPTLLQAHYAISNILDVSGIGRKISIIVDAAEIEATTSIHPNGSTDLASIISRRLLTQV